MEQTNEARAEDKPAYSMPRKEDEAARQQIQERGEAAQRAGQAQKGTDRRTAAETEEADCLSAYVHHLRHSDVADIRTFRKGGRAGTVRFQYRCSRTG